MKKNLIVGIMVVLFAGYSAYAVSLDDSQVKFKSIISVGGLLTKDLIGVSGDKVQAESIEINNKKLNAKFKFGLDGFKTGVAPRDARLRKVYLQTDKFPEAVLEVKDFDLEKVKEGKSDVPFSGMLSLHGVTKEIHGHIDFDRTGTNASAHAFFPINISDFNIDQPKILNLKVDTNFNVDVSLNIKDLN